MRAALTLALAAALLAAGCAARGNEDPFAFTRKPIYTGTFDLASVAGETATVERYWVTDGSIKLLLIQVWVNETAGSARVSVYDPGGNLAFSTDSEGSQVVPLQLGDWRVHVTGSPDAKGRADVMVVR